MEAEMKEIIITILQGRTFVFSLLHSILGGEPTEKLLEAVSSEDAVCSVMMFDEEESDAPRNLAEMLKCCRQVTPEQLDRMRMEYTRLFLGPERLIAPPWESVYLTTERALFQESTLDVRNWYRKYGYLLVKYPRIADDHISLMMHFLMLTTQKAADSLSRDQFDVCSRILTDQKQFEETHLLNWLDAYVKDITASPTREFYPQFVKAAAGFIRYDHHLLDELLEKAAL